MVLKKQDGFSCFTHSLMSWPFLGFAAYLAAGQPLNPAIDSDLLPWWRHFNFLVRKVACNYKRLYRFIKVWRIINYASFFRQIKLFDLALVPQTFSAVNFCRHFQKILPNLLRMSYIEYHSNCWFSGLKKSISRSEHLQNEGASDLWW